MPRPKPHPPAEPSVSGPELRQLLADLGGLERLQALQMTLVQHLRRQVETAVGTPQLVRRAPRPRRR